MYFELFVLLMVSFLYLLVFQFMGLLTGAVYVMLKGFRKDVVYSLIVVKFFSAVILFVPGFLIHILAKMASVPDIRLVTPILMFLCDRRLLSLFERRLRRSSVTSLAIYSNIISFFYAYFVYSGLY